MPDLIKTIFATSSGNSVAAISVVRISGPAAINTIQQFFKTKTVLEPRKSAAQKPLVETKAIRPSNCYLF